MNKKTKIGFALLVAMAFIMPSASIIADEGSTGNEADVTKDLQTTQPLVKSKDFTMAADGGQIASLDFDGGWPIEVSDIFINPMISAGDYPITAEFYRPDYKDGVDWTVLTTDTTPEPDVPATDSCDTIYKMSDGSTFDVTTSPWDANALDLSVTSDSSTDEIIIELQNPLGARWDDPQDSLTIFRDHDDNGVVDWAIIYWQDNDVDYYEYDGSSWSAAVLPPIFSVNYVAGVLTVKWTDGDGVATGRVAGRVQDYNAPTDVTLRGVVPCAAVDMSDYTANNDDTSEYLAVPQFNHMDNVTVSMKSDCDTVWIEFVSAGETIDNILVETQGGNNFDGSIYATGLGTNTVLFEIPRTELRVGNCNERSFWMNYDLEGKNLGSIARSVIEPIVEYDCGPAELKKFFEIYEWVLESEGDPVNETEIYCTDFEEPCDFYDEWATLDKKPDWGNNGAIDTWVWTDKKANSPTHSFHSTAGDTYLPNQYDILELNMDGNGVDISAWAGEQIRVDFSHYMKGDSIVINGTRFIQDGGQVLVDFDTGTDFASEIYYDNDWTDESLTIDVPSGATNMTLQFVFWSDPAFCYEGWYVDDVCITGITGAGDDEYTWEFVTDGHSQEQIMDGQYLEHTFDETWHAEEGIYKVCVWLQALDDCHRAVNGSGVEGYADSDMFCVEVEVADELCLADTDLYFDPVSPAWEGDDVTIFSDVENVGTLDATDVQVQVTVNRGEIQTTWTDDVENAPYDEDTYRTYRFGISPPGKADWHITDFDAASPSHSWAYFNETTMKYKNGVGNEDFSGSNYAGAHLAFGEPAFTAEDAANNPSVTFKAKWVLDQYDYVGYGIHSVESGYTSFYATDYGVDPADYGTWPDNPFMYGVQDTWKELTIDYTDLLSDKLTDPDFNVGKLMPVLMFFSDSSGNEVPGYSWSGFMVDDFEISKIVAGEEIIFQETQVIDSLNASTFYTPGEEKTVDFLWEDVLPGRYVVTETILNDDCDPTDNTQIRSYNVINYMQDSSDGTIEFIDHTGGGPGHWLIEDCCDGSIWAGDPATTMYGNNWDDVLYIAPDQNKSLPAAGGKQLELTHWYQLNDSDFAMIEISNDDGQHWSNLYTFTGTRPTMSGDMNPVTDSIGIPPGTNQIRFRFQSNNDTTNRGWFISHVKITGDVFEDDCTSMDNFIGAEYSVGNWWFTPDQYATTLGWGWSSMTEWVQMFDYLLGNPLPSPEETFGCYDPNVVAGWDNFRSLPVEAYPFNLNNSFDWTIDTEKVFYGWFEEALYLDNNAPDPLFVEYSIDGSDFEALANPAFWVGNLFAPVSNPGDELTLRHRLVSDDTWGPYYSDGPAVNAPVFYGMIDDNAPTTTITMDGTFDEVYGYYTSEVAVSLEASDDITGVANIYYELDGEQFTYDRPFIIEGDGEHTLCYWAVDNEGNVEEKKCVPPFRIDESGPGVEITGPEPGIYLFGNKLLDSDKYIFLFGGFTVTASASVDDAPLQTVEFYFNGDLIGEDTSAPFDMKISEKNSGSAEIKVVAMDVLGEDDEDSLTIDTYLKLF